MTATALAIVPQAPQSNVETYRLSTEAASICRDIVVASATTIQGRKYVCVEGWQAIAIAHGCTASARAVEAVEGGVRAIGEIRRMSDGAVIAEAEGFVGEDEPTWFGGQSRGKTLPKRADYAIRAMAQTRAISRACRSAFAHVVVMMNAGLSTTPAEEVPYGGFTDVTEPSAPRETARDRAAREADANGGTHPNNMPDAEDFDAAATALRIGGLLKTASTKAEIGQIWNNDSRADRARLKAADPNLYAALSKTLEFETQRVAPARPAPQAEDLLDDEIPF